MPPNSIAFFALLGHGKRADRCYRARDLLAAHPRMFGFVTFNNCTFLEREHRIVDAATGELAGAGSPCAVSQGSFGYNPEARRQATADVQNFLRLLFRL